MKCRFPHPCHRHHQQPHALTVSGHSLSPVKSLPANKSCKTLNNLCSAELSSSLLPLLLAAAAVLVQVSDTHNPGLTQYLSISTPSWAVRGLVGLPLGTRAANQQHGMNLRQAVLEAPLAVLAGLSLPLFNHVGATDSLPG